MNILIINDDGPRAPGLTLLRAVARQRWKEARIITMCTPPMSGASMSITPGFFPTDLRDSDLEEIEPGLFITRFTPTDLVDIAHLASDYFLPRGPLWHLVLCGMNHGANVGTDVLRSGTVGAAMTAAQIYSCPAIAVSLDTPLSEPIGEIPIVAEGILRDIIRTANPQAGECLNYNIPAGPSKGYANVPVAHYSKHRRPPLEIIPRTRDERSDLTELEKGYTTMSQIQIRLNPMQRY